MKQLKSAPAGAADLQGTGIPSEAEKCQLFAIDKDLEILYGQLVTNQVLSETDFCRVRQGTLQKLLGTARYSNVLIS